MELEKKQSGRIKDWSKRFETLGLSPVAPFLVEITKAFGFLAGQALLIAQPMASGIVKETTLERAAALLSDPERQEALRMRLEREKGEDG